MNERRDWAPVDWSPMKRLIYLRGNGATGGGGGGLPSAYRQVEYIGTDGSQYIDSGIECTSDLAVEFKIMVTSAADTHIAGGIDLSNNPVYFRHHYTPTRNETRYWMQYDNTVSPSSYLITSDVVNNAITVAIDPVNGTARYSGVEGWSKTSFTPVQSGLTTGKGYGILARIANDGTISSRPGRCYYFKLFRGGAMIGDFVPCVRKSDGEAGMYDTVTKTFFTNDGTGTFLIP